MDNKNKNIKKKDYKEVMAALKVFSLSEEEKASIKGNIMSFIEAHPTPAVEEKPKSSLAFLWTAEVPPHVVQLYRDRGFLRRAVTAWIRGSLNYGGGAIIVCSEENADLIRAELMNYGLSAKLFEDVGRFAVLNLEKFMATFMVNGMPDEARFVENITRVIHDVRAACGDPRAEIRTSGEMVNSFFREGNIEAARKLEEVWNKVIEKENIRRLCSYHVDHLSERAQEILPDLCRGHSQLLPEEDEAGFEQALTEAMNEILGEQQSRHAWERFTKESPLGITMPQSEAVLIGLHVTNPALAKKILSKVRSALAY